MGYYFFHLRVGSELICDDEGMALKDMEAALLEMRQTAIDVARASDGARACSIEVEREDGETIATMPVRRALS